MYHTRQVFALHPLYLSLDALSDDAPPEVQQEIQTARQELDLPVGCCMPRGSNLQHLIRKYSIRLYAWRMG